jgi:hypothetical protein
MHPFHRRSKGRDRVQAILVCHSGKAAPINKRHGGSVGQEVRKLSHHEGEPEMVAEGAKRGKRHGYARCGGLKAPKISVMTNAVKKTDRRNIRGAP